MLQLKQTIIIILFSIGILTSPISYGDNGTTANSSQETKDIVGSSKEPKKDKSDDETKTQPSSDGKPALDVAKLLKGLLTWDFAIVLGVTLLAGAVGGVVYELIILQGNIEKHHEPTPGELEEKFPYAIYNHMYDWGIWARIYIGALAAVVGLWVFTPTTTVAWLAISVASGAAGISIFRSMQDRITAAIALKDVNEAKQAMLLQATKLEELKKTPSLSNDALNIISEAKGMTERWTK